MTKDYGLTGQTVTVKRKSGESAAYPWGYAEQQIAITAEYPNFLVGTLLPHRHPDGFKESYPYTTTINKHDIQIGEMIVNGGAIR
ncbi:MAG: hypothetical protein PHN80_04270 [Hespellia sp.]|nr:hypothetical protein [Hespellia sp.]